KEGRDHKGAGGCEQSGVAFAIRHWCVLPTSLSAAVPRACQARSRPPNGSTKIEFSERYCKFGCQEGNQSFAGRNLLLDRISVSFGLPIDVGHERDRVDHPIFADAMRSVQ